MSEPPPPAAPLPTPVPPLGPSLAPGLAPLPGPPAGPQVPEELPRLRFDASNPSHVVAAVILFVTVLYVFGLPLYSLGLSLARGAIEPPQISAEAIVVSLALNVVVMGLGGWAVLALLAPDRDVLRRRLFLARDRPHGRAFGVGVGVTVALVLLYVVVVTVVARFVEISPNDVVAELGEQLTWPLVLFVAVASSLSEELYFRVLLLPRVGVVASSLLFGLVHLTYGNWLQVIVPALLGFVFAWLLLRTRSALAPVGGHFAWNFVQLAGAKLVADDPDLLAAVAGAMAL